MPAIEPYQDTTLPDRFTRWIEVLRQKLAPVPTFTKSAGSPEGVIDGNQGARYFRTDGAPGTLLYVKTTNGGNTGWIAYA